MKHFLRLTDLSKDELYEIIDLAIDVKKKPISNRMGGKTLGLLFEKPSTRTRVSFEAGFYQMGGNCVVITPQTSQISRGETIEDTAKVLSRYLDMIAIRTFDHERIEQFAGNASIPVINALTNLTHPCQLLADMMTVVEKKGRRFDSMKIAYFGDGNNMANTWIEAASIFGFHLSVATPQDFAPNAAILHQAITYSGNKNNIEITDNPREAAKDADLLYTDVWNSMNQKESNEKIINLKNYQVNQELAELAKPDFLFMHCLPAHVGQEVSESVYRSKHSVIYQEAENRLHTQKALMLKLIELNLQEDFGVLYEKD
ncbi:MAG: ornithine carbamoyltransferase, catabolic [bacterium]|nr:MAG: ornithine carbamoyltransferase, catabolic [bacterium]